MKPIKFTDYLAKKPYTAPKTMLFDLREYGLVNAAPQEDGHTILTMRFDPRNGTLVPAAA